MKVLCLDIGSKRIGVAASDPLGLIAEPLTVIIRRGDDRDIENIAVLCSEHETGKIVVGIPLDQEGGEGAAARKIRKFADKIAAYFKSHNVNISIEFWDERYSTRTAEERLIDADMSRSRRREVIDKMAAQVILEDYMSAHEAGADDGEGVDG